MFRYESATVFVENATPDRGWGPTVFKSLSFVTPTPEDSLFEQAFELGESENRYLGMLTRGAWAEYANGQRLLVAVRQDQAGNGPSKFAGYAAFRLPRSEVALTHLVVHPSARNQRVAQALVNELTFRYSHLRGIAARCRRDYPANGMWPHLGFVALGDRPGRSAAGHLLTFWWRDHGHADLMSWDGAPDTVTSVAIDTNVFLDLAIGNPNQPSERILLSDLEDRVEILVTPELHNEIDRRRNRAERLRLHSVANTYPRLAVPPELMQSRLDTLSTIARPRTARTQDRSDLIHLAYAAAAGVRVFVTRDASLQRRLSVPVRQFFDISLLSPEELVAHIDQIQHSPSYSPAALLGTGYNIVEVAASDTDRVAAFLNTAGSERRNDFQARVRELARMRPASHRLLYLDPTASAIAFLGTAASGGVLNVCLGRMRATALQSTLAAQIVASIRPLASKCNATAIRVTDPHVDPLIFEALLADGFVPGPRGPLAVTISKSCVSSDLPAEFELAAANLDESEKAAFGTIASLVKETTRTTNAISLERRLRPLRIIDADIPTWIAPIKPAHASGLFDYPPGLFGRPDELGISIEHVYYRGGRSGESAPARVLWYVSGEPHMEVFACSDIVEVIDGQADALYDRFRRLGVYERSDVQQAAGRSGVARALRVVNTEIFDRPVRLDRLRDLANECGQSLQLVSMSRINGALFGAILDEARVG